MKTRSDPSEWLRQEEMACHKARGRMRRGKRGSLMPVYVVAAVIGIGVVYLLLVVAGAPVPGAP